MLKSIKTSEANRAVVADLTAKLGIGPENLIARIAFAYSIAQGNKLALSNIQDSKGKEYSSTVLFGDYSVFYTAMASQHYGLHKTDYDIPKYIKLHIDDGLGQIAKIMQENPNLSMFDFIFEQIDDGIKEIMVD